MGALVGGIAGGMLLGAVGALLWACRGMAVVLHAMCMTGLAYRSLGAWGKGHMLHAPCTLHDHAAALPSQTGAVIGVSYRAYTRCTAGGSKGTAGSTSGPLLEPGSASDTPRPTLPLYSSRLPTVPE